MSDNVEIHKLFKAEQYNITNMRTLKDRNTWHDII